MSSAKRHPALVHIVAWLVLLTLLGLSVLSAYWLTGILQLIAQFGIAVTQAIIIFLVFMRLRSATPLAWLFAGAGFFWLVFLYGLSLSDYATRSGWP